jgi:hypothetical protein
MLYVLYIPRTKPGETESVRTDLTWKSQRGREIRESDDKDMEMELPESQVLAPPPAPFDPLLPFFLSQSQQSSGVTK